jgi:hypothetical protein
VHPTAIVTILSSCVTIISTVQSKLGFERKWIANRMTRSALLQLVIDERTETVSIKELAAQLKNILKLHDTAITAADSSLSPDSG